MKKVVFVLLCLCLLTGWTSSSPYLEKDNWDAVNPISPKFGNSQELAEKFSHWPQYTGAYDTMDGGALRWCKYEASLNFEYREGTYPPDAKRNYGFIYKPQGRNGAPRTKPSDPQWMKDCQECMEALGYIYTGPKE